MESANRIDRRRPALAALSLSVLLASLGTSSANVLLPELARVLDATFAQVQWVVLAYLLAMTTLIVGVGRLADLLGRGRLLVGGLALFMLASLACAVAPTLGVLVAARAVQGLGAAAMTALAMALVGETIPKADTGRAMGLLGSMSAVGTALGPSLAGLLLAGAGWRTVFLLNLPLGLAAFVLARRSLPMGDASSPRAGASFDRAGTVLLAATLAAYALAMTPRSGFGPAAVALLLMAAVGVVLFLRIEARAATPLIRLALFRDPLISAGFAMSALVTTVVMVTLVVGPFYLAQALGLPTAAVGAVMSVGPVVAALAGVPSGRIVDRVGPNVATVAGLVVMGGGASALAFAPGAFGVAGYVAALVVVTAGYALFQAANNTAVMVGVSGAERGVVAGVLSLSRNLGLITGASAMGTIFALASGAADITTASADAIASGWRITFVVATSLIVTALAVAMRVPRPAASRSSPPTPARPRPTSRCRT